LKLQLLQQQRNKSSDNSEGFRLNYKRKSSCATRPLTLNPNVGGFGQTEVEVVLQDPYLGLAVSHHCTSTMLFLKTICAKCI
jgi:hypothetical protein